MYKVIGIDEAGKGPVIGSLVIGFAIINLEKKEDLNSYLKYLEEKGVKDSKKLTPKKRRELYADLKNNMDLKFVQLTPALIDSNFNKGGKLNDLEIEAIVKILESEKPNLFIVDSLTAEPQKFVRKILDKLSFKPDFISENKADDNYTIVAAASIIAKELREEELKQIRENLNIEVGSGYPSDPKTIEFLKNNFYKKEYDFLFRKSWKTYQKLVKDSQKNLEDYF